MIVSSPKSLWDQLGGDAKMQQIVGDFVTAAISDPKVNYTRSGRFNLDDQAIAKAKSEAFKFISSAAGGPHQYTGKSLVEIHHGMEITDDEFSAIALDFKLALEKHGTPASLVTAVMQMVESTRPHIVANAAK